MRKKWMVNVFILLFFCFRGKVNPTFANFENNDKNFPSSDKKNAPSSDKKNTRSRDKKNTRFRYSDFANNAPPRCPDFKKIAPSSYNFTNFEEDDENDQNTFKYTYTKHFEHQNLKKYTKRRRGEKNRQCKNVTVKIPFERAVKQISYVKKRKNLSYPELERVLSPRFKFNVTVKPVDERLFEWYRRSRIEYPIVSSIKVDIKQLPASFKFKKNSFDTKNPEIIEFFNIQRDRIFYNQKKKDDLNNIHLQNPGSFYKFLRYDFVYPINLKTAIELNNNIKKQHLELNNILIPEPNIIQVLFRIEEANMGEFTINPDKK